MPRRIQIKAIVALLRRQPCTWAWKAIARLSSLFFPPSAPWFVAEQQPLQRGRQIRRIARAFPLAGESRPRHLKLALLLGTVRSGWAAFVLLVAAAPVVGVGPWPALPCWPADRRLRSGRSLPSPQCGIRWFPTTGMGRCAPHHRTGGGPSGADPTAWLPTGVIPAPFIQGPWAVTKTGWWARRVTDLPGRRAAVFQPGLWLKAHRGVLLRR